MQTVLTPAANWIVILPVLLPLLAAALLLMFRGRFVPPMAGAAVVALAVAGCDLVLLRRVAADGPIAMTMGRWLPPFGISFTADTAGAAFALAAAFVTLVALVYSRLDPPAPADRPSFYALALLLLAGVGGAFLTGDLFNLYVWFEVMLIASSSLLAFSGMPGALDGAVKYGLLNFVGTSLFLAALGLLYGCVGTLNMADIARVAPTADPAVMTSVAALLFVAFGTKAATFPVNAWLPASYHTPPAAVSALLGGVLTKVGVYALLRTLILLLPASGDLLHPVIAIVAGATLLLAPLGALAETNLRRAIGYFLIGGVGAAIAGLALSDADGIGGAVAYVIHAMLTISALYLVAGLIERARGGETDIRRMMGPHAANAPLSILFFVLLVGVAGVPPFLGFWPKLLLLQGAVEGSNPGGPDAISMALAACLLLNAFLTLLAGARLWARIFWRSAELTAGAQSPAAAQPARSRDLVGLGTASGLVAVIVVMGLWPEPLLSTGRAAAAGLLAPQAYIAAVGLGGTP